jgi:hypothetical protein
LPPYYESGDKDAIGLFNVNLLIAADRDYDKITALPRMSAIPVNLERINAAAST